MAMLFIANDLEFAELGASGVCVAPGRYYSSDASSPFGPPPLFSSLENDIREIAYTGVHGLGTKDFGERGLIISASLIYADVSKGATMDMLTSDFCTTLNQRVRYAVVMPDARTFGGCKLIRGGASLATWGPAMSNLSVAVVKAVWKQYNVSEFGPNGSPE